MSNLKAALDPKSIAIIGASENPNKVGGRPVHYLTKFGFKDKIYPINPSRPEIQGSPPAAPATANRPCARPSCRTPKP